MRLLIIFMLSPFFLLSQTQIGNDIDGLIAGDNAGQAVSISSDGLIVAVGSPDYSNEKGQIRVFENISNDWIQIGESITGEAEGDHFGSSVSLSGDGDIIAIGGPNNAGEDTDAGHVRVLENISGVWTQIGNDINGIDAGNRMGLFVSLSNDGTKLAISGYWCCGIFHATPGVGDTRIYENISGVWTLIGGVINTGFYGISDVALSADGSVVAIASSGGGNPGWSSFFGGGVVVYKNISGIWTQIGDPFLRDTSWWSYDYFGGVSLTDDGSKIVIGGSITSVYENIANEWVQLGEDIETGGFMPKVSLSDSPNILVIGGTITRVYENSSGNWAQLGVDINEVATGDNFGASLELSGDGTTLIVGAPNSDRNGVDAGHARVFDFSELLSSDEYTLTQFSLYPNPAKDQFTIQLQNSQDLEKVNMYNNLGQLVKTAETKLVKTTNLATGLYYVEVITRQGKATKKLIIK